MVKYNVYKKGRGVFERWKFISTHNTRKSAVRKAQILENKSDRGRGDMMYKTSPSKTTAKRKTKLKRRK